MSDATPPTGPSAVPPTVVLLRPLQAEDAPVLASWARDGAFVEHADWTPGLPCEEHESFWRHRIIEDPPQELLRLAAVLPGAQDAPDGHDLVGLVGYVDLYGQGQQERELGYVVGPSTRWGRGLGTAVARAGLEHAFTVLGLQEVWAEAVPLNAPSVRILERIGMRRTGEGEQAEFLGVPARYVQYRLTREEYAATRGRPGDPAGTAR